MVGSHLLYNLVQKESRIRAIYRREETLKHVKKVFAYHSPENPTLFDTIEWIKSDLSDLPKLEEVFKGVTKVFHCAAYISFDPSNYKKLLKSNKEGTANIVNLCLAHGVQKLGYVSSIATIGDSLSNELATEETEFNPINSSVYAITKHMAEMEVWRGAQEGLEVVIVNPGVILGPGFRKSGSGPLLQSFNNSKGYYFKGGTGFVGVYDVVAILIRLMQSNLKNERFILVSHNATFKEIQHLVADVMGGKKANRPVPKWIIDLLWRLDWLKSKILGKKRALTRQTAQSLNQRLFYSAEKIEKALDYTFEPIEETIANCAGFLRDS